MCRRKKRVLVSPFVGTGVVEGALTNLGHTVRASDLDVNIVNAHKALSSPARRAATARHFEAEYSRLSRAKTERLRGALYKKTLRDVVLRSQRAHGCPLRAAQFALAQKCTFNGAELFEGLTSLPPIRFRKARLPKISGPDRTPRCTHQRRRLHDGAASEACRRPCDEELRAHAPL